MKAMMSVVVLALSICLAQPVLAHGEKPRHGGVMSEAKDLNFELVAENGKAAIYILDHGKPMTTANISGKLTVMNGAQQLEVPLQPAGDNKLISSSEVKLEKGGKAVAFVTLTDKRNIGVRFVLK